MKTQLDTLRRMAEQNMPSTNAIGRHLASGRLEQAHRDALHREYLRGRASAFAEAIQLLGELAPKEEPLNANAAQEQAESERDEATARAEKAEARVRELEAQRDAAIHGRGKMMDELVADSDARIAFLQSEVTRLTAACLSETEVAALKAWASEARKKNGCTAWGPRFDAALDVALRLRDGAKKKAR